jgi:hypothetical protein
LGHIVGEQERRLDQEEGQELPLGVLLQPEDELGQLGQQHVRHGVVYALAVVEKPEQLLRRLLRLLVAAL